MGVQFKDKDLISETELDDASSVLPIWETEQNKTFKVNPGMLRMQPVAVCNSAAGDNKVATVSNIKGFQLRNGMFITVVFTNGNTADAPTLNINNLGAWPMVCENTAVGSGAYGAGAIITVQYIEVDSSHKYYALVGHNTAKKENGVITQADGDTIYNKQSVDNSFLLKSGQNILMAGGIGVGN